MNLIIDVVFCIDITSKMELHLDKIKAIVINFENDIRNWFEYCYVKKQIFFKIRIITFGDSSIDKKLALKLSPVFIFTNQNDHDFLELKKYVENIKCIGGFYTSDSLRALSMVLEKEWTHRSSSVDNCRNVVFVFSNTRAISNPKCKFLLIDKIRLLWNESNWRNNIEPIDGIDDCGKRLILFTKEKSPWTDIFNTCEKVILCTDFFGKDISDSYNDIISAVCDSI